MITFDIRSVVPCWNSVFQFFNELYSNFCCIIAFELVLNELYFNLQLHLWRGWEGIRMGGEGEEREKNVDLH